jgi:Right handed beta helix region
VRLASAMPGHGVGFCVTGGIISASWRGVYGDGAGVTDLRISGLLEHSNTYGITLGPSAGGGGLQLSHCHLVYASAPRGAYRLGLGQAAGDFTVIGNYFDKNGPSPAVVLATSKGKISDNHFLADALCDGPMVTVSTASQNLTFRGNDCRANGSPMTALLQLFGGGGPPANGVYEGNNVYGSHPDLIAPLIDRHGAPIRPTSTATTYVAGNVVGD